jgi:uroporphyrinogen decarboxylase
MNSRERVLSAMMLERPDKIPFGEMGIDRAFAAKLMNWDLSFATGTRDKDRYSTDEMKAIAEKLHLDTIFYYLRPPIYADIIVEPTGYLHYGEGKIKSVEDCEKIQLPDPYDDNFYIEAAKFAKEKGDYAALLICRAGFYPAMASMGFENFCLSLYLNRPFVEEVIDLYFNWAKAVAERVSSLGFDIFVTTDDLASKNGLFVSPDVFQDLFIPRLNKIKKKLSIPWLMHSDGDIMDIIPDIINLGVAGLHPFEKDAINIKDVKNKFGDKICIWGNLDLNLLALASPEEVEKEVYYLIENIGTNGAFVLTSGNSITSYCKIENIIRMSETIYQNGTYK